MGDHGGAVALFDEYVVASTSSVRAVEGILKDLYNKSGSLARADADNELKLILEKVGDGLIVVATTEGCAVERCEGLGKSFNEFDVDAEEGKSKIVLLFRNERSAENAADDYDKVADFLEREWDTEIDDTEADGPFVIGEERFDLFEDSSSRGGGNSPSSPPAVAATVTPAGVAMAQQAPATNVEETFFAECRREMVTELGTDAGAFCECLWEGIGDLGISRSDRLQVVRTIRRRRDSPSGFGH